MCLINRKTLLVSLGVLLVVMLGGCGETKVVDTAQKEEYIAAAEEVKDSYKYDTVIAGDLYENVETNGTFYIHDSKAARADYKYGEMIFEDFETSAGKYVNAGDVIANVHIKVSKTDIEEMKLSIQRMLERLETDQVDFYDSDALLKKKAYAIHDSQAQGVALKEYEESVALHNQELASRRVQVADKQEELAKMEAAAAITQITAPIDGYLTDVAVLKAGDIIRDKAIIAVVEPSVSNIIQVSNTDGYFRYGKEVEVTITTQSGEEEMTGTVITPSRISVASQVDTKTACIRLDKEVEGLPSKEDIKKIVVTTHGNEIKNTLMIKRGSLTIDNSNAYATVVQADGSFQRKSVIIGGQNKEYYWIFKGLEEGDTVVIP